MDTIFLNACKNAQKAIVMTLLKKGGINLNKRDALGNTPLYYTSLKGAKDIVTLLLREGADPSLANNNSETPLHCAARNGNKEIMLQLKEYGADINATDKNGESPLFMLSGIPKPRLPCICFR